MVPGRHRLPPEAIDVVKVYEGEPLPEPGRHQATIITGSWAMVTDQHPWSEATASWIRRAVAQGTPLLGVCYGHQLMAHALGGAVGYHPGGREMGCLDIERLPAGEADPWLAGCPPRFRAHLTHLQTVLHLPPGSTALARSAHDPHQIVRYSPHAVSVQFHPEFTSDIQAACITARAQLLRSEGLDPSAMLQDLAPAPTPPALLHRFLDTYAPFARTKNACAIQEPDIAFALVATAEGTTP